MTHEYCEGCRILKSKKPQHGITDYVTAKACDILFVSESFRWEYGKAKPFGAIERSIIDSATSSFNYDFNVEYTAAIKCPYVKKQDLKVADQNLCRQHLNDTLQQFKPKLIYACGNLAFNMLTRKSGIEKYRGEMFVPRLDYDDSIVVPIYHPFAVKMDQTKYPLFRLDIENAYNKIILGIEDEDLVKSYDLITEESHLEKHQCLFDMEGLVSCDLETTNLDFLKDKIMTIAFSYDYEEEARNFAIPVDHRDSPFLHCLGVGPDSYKTNNHYIRTFLNKVFLNPKLKKIFHNAKYDLKFLFNYGFELENVGCTKIMAKLVNENRPNSLRDLVKEYFGRTF